MDIPILAQDAARQRQAQQPAETPDVIEATCGFIVYQTADGAWVATQDLDVPVTVQRPPTRHDIIGACEIIKQEFLRQMATQEITMNVLGNFTRAMADPQFQLGMLQASETARAAAAAANGKLAR